MPASPRTLQATSRLSGTISMAIVYTTMAIAMTWPLAADLGTRLAADQGDPAFNTWVLMWTAGQMLEALSGNIGALTDYWHGNILYPEPLTLAYSEHLTAQALQALPIYAATGNGLVAYNVVFISTFALSGLAVYLLVRDLTNQPLAAFVAGLAYAYAPYRFGQLSHVQVLSSYWMPLALLGFHRYFTRVTTGAGVMRRRWALTGASTALVMQHLSCGYFMLFFAPFAGAYCLFEIAQRRLALAWRMWLELGIAAVGVAAATFPFVQPYFGVRDLGTAGVRSLGEIVMFSADTHAFASSAAPMLGRWSYFKPEGDGFPGFTILLFSVFALIWGGRRLLLTLPWSRMRDWHFLAVVVSGTTAAVVGALVIWLLINGQFVMRLGNQVTIFTRVVPALDVAMVAVTVCLVLMAMARSRAGTISSDAFGFFVLAAVAAALLALGPQIEVAGRRVGPGPYLWLLNYVPGFDGLRVPARMLMLVSLFLAVLVGLGAAALLRTRLTRVATVCVLLGAAGVLFEGWMAPLPMNVPVTPGAGLASAPPPVLGRGISPVYRTIRDLPGSVVLAEFPFGDPAYEPLAVLYAGYHRRPLINGYSGFTPRSYDDRLPALRDAPADPDRLHRVLTDAGVTHILVHEGAFLDDRGPRVSMWLLSHGARQVTAQGSDRLFVWP